MTWIWEGPQGQNDYDEWISRVLRDCPEVWEASEGPVEELIVRYVRTLEQRVVAAYGTGGLEPELEHGAASNIIRALDDQTALVEWMSRNMPHVSIRHGVAKPIIELLDICRMTLANVVPVMQSIVAAMTPKLRAAGLMKRCACKNIKYGEKQPGQHHEEICPMRGAWI